MTFLEYFNKNVHKVKLVDKRKSRFMRAIAWALSVLGIMGRDEFLDNFTTTIGSRIYTQKHLDWDNPSPLMFHELTHVLQFSFLMAVRYLLSSKWRMRYESEAVQSVVLCTDLKPTTAWMDRMVRQFTKYRIDETTIRNEIVDRISEARRNLPLENARRVYYAWRDYNGRHR